ncbi:unnamed protein product [Malus baccata var. baccata]
MQKESNADWKRNRHSMAADGGNEPAEFKTPSSMQRDFFILYANPVATHFAKAILKRTQVAERGSESASIEDTSVLFQHALYISDIAASVVLLSSKIAPVVSIGEDSLIYDSTIPSGMQVGSLSVVVGINVPEVNSSAAKKSFRFILPDRHCLWEIPLLGRTAFTITPKKVLEDSGIHENDIWFLTSTHGKCLWNAKIFHFLSYFEMLNLASWLMGLGDQNSKHLYEAPTDICTSSHKNKIFDAYANHSFHPRMVKVEFPVRVDFVGGWSNTPPWTLEHAGCVLNMAISLEGSLPIGTNIEKAKSTGVFVSDDVGNELHIEDLTSITTPFDDNDPFRLVKSALLVTGIIHENVLASKGLQIRTWARVPRGSGLGTSSILAAVVVK